MTYQQPVNNRKKDLAKIHIGAKALGWKDEVDDTEYRDQLWAICRVKSAADLDFAGRQKFIDHMKACGFKPTKPRRKNQQKNSTENASAEQVQLIKKIWNALHAQGIVHTPGEEPLRKFIKEWTKRDHPQKTGYDAPELLPSNVAVKITERLKQWAKRSDVNWK